MKAYLYAGALLAVITTPALASPFAAAGVEAAAGAIASQGQGQGQGQQQGQSNENSGSVNNETGNSRALGVALGQAPTSVSGICGKGNKFAFGALEWTDFSSKCFNYMIALEAAKQGNYDLANQWVVRADNE